MEKETYYFFEQQVDFVTHFSHLVGTGLFCIVIVTLYTILCKIEDTVTLDQTTKAQSGNRCTVLLFL